MRTFALTLLIAVLTLFPVLAQDPPPSSPAAGEAAPPTQETTDSAASSPDTTDSAASSPDTTETTGASEAPAEETTDSVEVTAGTTQPGKSGHAGTITVRFNPPQAIPLTIRESHSEEIKILLESGQCRSRLTTSETVGRAYYERLPQGWRRTEIVDSIQRSFEGLALADEMANAMVGARIVTLLDANGGFVGLADPEGYRNEVLTRLAKTAARDTAALLLTPQLLDSQVRTGWDQKIGRFLKEPLKIGQPTFEQVTEELPDIGPMHYFRCYLATGLAAGPDGKPRVEVEIISFPVTLTDGMLEGIPDELSDDFAEWAQGRELEFSSENLSVAGDGDAQIDLAGIGTVAYSLIESFSLEPALVKVQKEASVEVPQVYFVRCDELTYR